MQRVVAQNDEWVASLLRTLIRNSRMALLAGVSSNPEHLLYDGVTAEAAR